MITLAHRPLFLALVLVLAGASAWVAPAMAQDSRLPGPSSEAAPAPPSVAAASSDLPLIVDDNYLLGTGDKIKITVYGEPDLSGEFVIDGSGQIQFPLIGQVRAANLTVHRFVDELLRDLGSQYLRDPKVSVQIENFRPFYIIGEVNKPGEYPYEHSLNILAAIALAGGYTYRADDADVYIRRAGATAEQLLPAVPTTRVNPGDIVRVPERIF